MKVRSYLVVGAGRFGGALARTLFELGHEVVVVDRHEDALEEVMAHATHALVLDAANEAELAKVGVGNFDAVVIAIGDSFEASVLATAAAKALGAKHLVAKAGSSRAAEVLAKVGADHVVRPEHDMGERLAQQLVTPSLVDAFALGEAHGVLELVAGRRLVGTLAHLRLPHRYAVQVVAIERGDALTVGPKADFEVAVGDKLVVIGSTEALDRFREGAAD
jgi:trk system potassium uptake protein TrkA